MKVSQATKCFLGYHRMNSKKNTVKNYLGISLLAYFLKEVRICQPDD